MADSGIFTVSDFVTHIKAAGIQSANRYHLDISLPDKLIAKLKLIIDDELANEVDAIDLNIDDEENSPYPQPVKPKNPLSELDISKVLSLTALNVGVPGMNVSSVDLQHGSTRKIAYDKSNGELNITFRCSGNMIEKKIFDAWIQLIFQPDHKVAFYDDYIAPMFKIYSVNKANSKTYSVDITEVYPSIITELPFDREGADTVLLFSVTFNFYKIKKHPLESVEALTPTGISYISSIVPPLITDENLVVATSLPDAPETHNTALFVADIVKAISRIVFEVENGNLKGPMAKSMILSIVRDAKNAFGDDNPLLSVALDYAIDINFILGRLGV